MNICEYDYISRYIDHIETMTSTWKVLISSTITSCKLFNEANPPLTQNIGGVIYIDFMFTHYLA